MVFSFSWVIALAVVGEVYGGEYYVYQDLSGKLVISNNAPPPGSKILKRETLSEVTDQQIAESQVREDTAGFDNRLSSLENTIGELTENLRAQGEVINNVPEGYGDTNIAVGVTQGPTIVAKPPHKKFNRPAYFKRSLPNAQPRSAAPAARCCGGGRAG